MTDGSAIVLVIGHVNTPCGRVIQRQYRGIGRREYYRLAHAARDTVGRPSCRTSGGRTVYGGGGIYPDVVLAEPQRAPLWLARLHEQDVVTRWMNAWLGAHPDALGTVETLSASPVLPAGALADSLPSPRARPPRPRRRRLTPPQPSRHRASRGRNGAASIPSKRARPAVTEPSPSSRARELLRRPDRGNRSSCVCFYETFAPDSSMPRATSRQLPVNPSGDRPDLVENGAGELIRLRTRGLRSRGVRRFSRIRLRGWTPAKALASSSGPVHAGLLRVSTTAPAPRTRHPPVIVRTPSSVPPSDSTVNTPSSSRCPSAYRLSAHDNTGGGGLQAGRERPRSARGARGWYLFASDPSFRAPSSALSGAAVQIAYRRLPSIPISERRRAPRSPDAARAPAQRAAKRWRSHRRGKYSKTSPFRDASRRTVRTTSPRGTITGCGWA